MLTIILHCEKGPSNMSKIREEQELSILKELAKSLESEKRDKPSDESDAFGLYISQCLK